MADVKADTPVAHNEDQGADIELGGPEVQEETAAPAEAEASTSSISDSKADAASAAATSASRPDINGGDNSTSTGKRAGGAEAAAQSEDRSLPPSKRTRVAPPGGAQRRLFGVLTKTLSKFQEETKKDSEASKRRAELEERLAAKRKEEQDAIDARTGHERTLRNLKFEIIKKEDEKNAFIAIYKARRASKLSLANFLCTKAGEGSSSSNFASGSNSSAALGTLKPAPLPELPHALPPSSTHSSSSTKPLYYLPFKLLPWQADKIDGQIEDMREDLDKEEDSWREELRQREDEIRELKAKRAELTGGESSHHDSSSSRRRGSRRDADDEEMRGDSALADRAPLPEREAYDELSGDARAVSSEPPRDKEDSTMTPADGDDRLEY